MTYTEHLTYYVANFVDELVKCGVTDVVISPGSRSTPLALAFAEHEGITHWVNLDERSASFFALGMAKEQNKPVALLCTSGTAAANYYPAIIEASHSRVPLLVLTADRPHELRDVGAPQAMDQLKLYGNYVKWFHEMALPDKELKSYVRSTAQRAVFEANKENAGPVHLNFPFREPLVLDFTLPNIWESDQQRGYHQFVKGEQHLSSQQLELIFEKLNNKKRGLLVCGPQLNKNLRNSVARLARKWNIPVLADPLSQLRSGNYDKTFIVETYDAILKSKGVRDELQPDFIIRFGAMPVSKPYLFYVKENRHIPQFVVEAEEGYRDPTLSPTKFIYAEPTALCEKLEQFDLAMDEQWTSMWLKMNEMAREQLASVTPMLTEGHTVTIMQELFNDEHILFTGNSMPVRDVDTFFLNTDKDVTILGNRGVNGIDGIVSSAVGAAAHGKKVTLLIGDLSLFHDLNGLLVAKQYNLDITIVLINNNGGGIFSFLSQAEEKKHFEVLFGTPLHLSFEKAAEMYEANYSCIESWDQFRKGLTNAYETGGIHLLEIKTNREENVRWHRGEWAKIEENILKLFR